MFGGQKDDARINSCGISHLLPCMLEERSVLIFLERDPQFFLCIHDDGAVPGNRLADWSTGNKEEAYSVLLRSHRDFVAVTVKDYDFISANTITLEIKVI